MSEHIAPEVRAVESPWLTDAGRELRDWVQDLVPLIRSQAREGERIGALTPDVLQALDEVGVYRMTMPVEWGGSALGARDLVEVVAALGEADGSAAWSAFVGVGLRNFLALQPQVVEEIRKDVQGWVGPALVGASVFATTVGNARKVDGGWLVNGRWAFGSGCKHARWALVGVAFDPAEGGGTGRGVVVLEREQFEILDDWHVMGLSGTSSNSLRVTEDIFVPDHRFLDLAEFPPRLDQIRHHYSGAAFRQSGRALLMTVALSSTAITLGMARGALSCFAEQAIRRKPFTLPYPSVAEMASAQVAVGRAQAMIVLAGSTIERYADQVDARTDAGLEFGDDEESEISLALAYAANLCEDAINLLQKTLGSSTVSLSNPIQRFVRDARVVTSHGAIRVDPLAEQNGRRILGLKPFPMVGAAVPQRGVDAPPSPLG
ncbi:acyl-CoA dehydrogenase family protein [Streptomyces sp. N50]|uniref:acyl-CoA dehydrogenase family protein n=1 Tax=Streptomyces sp. N50 TaxID=3081765 RepID=UPI002962326D|nr:acyl-CoA dehydrogenase family protein [Streptomyces sp. N50]WOX07430.1 acyl-CoA dehydrogenase family protein [Streptomyces sp. N50]